MYTNGQEYQCQVVTGNFTEQTYLVLYKLGGLTHARFFGGGITRGELVGMYRDDQHVHFTFSYEDQQGHFFGGNGELIKKETSMELTWNHQHESASANIPFTLVCPKIEPQKHGDYPVTRSKII